MLNGNLIYAISKNIKGPSDLQSAMPEATKWVLNSQLKVLEVHEIIAKNIFHQLPQKVEYSLTPLGEFLIPIINAMNVWGDQNRGFLEKVIMQINPQVQVVK